MTENNLIVYKASAGSGKTFNLVLEYVSLLIKDTRAYRNILAVTFTNKATAEMKQRILSELYSIRIGEDTNFFKALVEINSSYSEDIIRRNTSEALDNILHDYSYFSIQTIDAFLQRVMRNMAKELGVGSNYNLILDDDEVVEEAIKRLIESTSDDQALMDWYMDIVSKKMEDGKRLNIEKELKDFSRNLSKETFKKFEKEIKSIEKSNLNNFKKEGKEKIEEIRKCLIGYGERFEKIISENGLSVDDFSSKGRGIAGGLLKIKLGEFDFRDKQYFVKALEGSENWFVKGNQTLSNLSLVDNSLLPLLNEYYNYYDKNSIIMNTWNAILPHIDNIGLLKDIANHRDNILSEENKFLLSNTSKLLSDIISLDNNSDISFIYEKIGTQLKYIMIDEFQDTSHLNWEDLRPLVSESIDSGYKSIIVGDVKQSIYRWRNGDWKILNDIDKGITYDTIPTNPHIPEIKSLTDNFRTDGKIVEFNNLLFSEGIDLFCKNNNELSQERINLIKGVFSDAKQNVKENAKGKGELRCRFMLNDKAVKGRLKTKSALIEEIEYYLSKGYKLNDIAILLRNNLEISDMVDFLAKNNYIVVSDLAFSFCFSKSINLIIDSLRYISDKGNTISLCNLKRFKLSDDKVFEQDINNIKEIPEELSWLRNREELIRKPLFDLVIFIIKELDLDKDEKELSFITSFCDKLQDYTNGNSSDINSFLKYWDDELSEKKIAISDDVIGIRLLSIHKSKGLEYPVIILPYANWELYDIKGGKTELWLENKNQKEDIPAFYAKWKDLKDTIYKEEYQDEIMQQYVDNLNILYVALTRPKNALSIIGQLSEGKKGINIDNIDDVSKYIFSLLFEKGFFKEETKKIEDNDDENKTLEREFIYYNLSQEKKLKENKEEETKNIFKIIPNQEQMLSGFNGAEIRYSQTKIAEDFINALSEGKTMELTPRLKGIILHNILSNIIIKDDSSKALEQLLASGNILQENKSFFETLINKMLSQNDVKEWFEGKYRVLNEADIIVKEKDRISSKRPDRLMIGEDEVIIVDYKFATSKNNIDLYSSQLNEYKFLLEEMGYKNIKSYLWFVSFDNEEFSSELLEVK